MVRLPLWIPCFVCALAGLLLGLWMAQAKIDRLQIGMAGMGLMIQMQNGGARK